MASLRARKPQELIPLEFTQINKPFAFSSSLSFLKPPYPSLRLKRDAYGRRRSLPPSLIPFPLNPSFLLSPNPPPISSAAPSTTTVPSAPPPSFSSTCPSRASFPSPSSPPQPSPSPMLSLRPSAYVSPFSHLSYLASDLQLI
jgi:hypothetical protein